MLAFARAFVAEHAPDGLIADGFDEAIIGVASVFGKTVVLYDRAKCIDILARGNEGEDALLAAEEYFTFNVEGAYVGDGTPAFATLIVEAS